MVRLLFLFRGGGFFFSFPFILFLFFSLVNILNMSNNYQIYLNSKHWNKIKSEIYKNRPRCEICGRKYWLNIHHKSYENLGNEKPEDLIVFCRFCHHEWHRNKELRDYVKKRELKKKLNEERFKDKPKLLRKKYRKGGRYFHVKFSKINKPKNYAGLFTWKAEESKK